MYTDKATTHKHLRVTPPHVCTTTSSPSSSGAGHQQKRGAPPPVPHFLEGWKTTKGRAQGRVDTKEHSQSPAHAHTNYVHAEPAICLHVSCWRREKRREPEEGDTSVANRRVLGDEQLEFHLVAEASCRAAAHEWRAVTSCTTLPSGDDDHSISSFPGQQRSDTV